jgi:protein KRI1
MADNNQATDRPAKRLKLLDEDSDLEEDSKLTINDEFAKRFQHNQQRVERQRLEEKYGSNSDSSSSEDETEDDEGDLADEALDEEIAATLNAIRSKDPRIYQKDVKFYSSIDSSKAAAQSAPNSMPKEKPLYLKDYHRENLLRTNGAEQDEFEVPIPYAEEQATLKATILSEINDIGEDQDNDDVDDELLLRKRDASPLPASNRPAVPDPTMADEAPEAYLSNFFASRAWVPLPTSRFDDMESDDEEEERRAEEFEQAYNLRFEDPNTANATLVTHSREAAAKYSVRRDETNSRKKTRDREREKKEEEKRERTQERKRLKSLKLQDMEEKLERIRDAAGFKGREIQVEDWADMLEADWDDDKWTKQMALRFGTDYYDNAEGVEEGEGGQPEGVSAVQAKTKKIRKPKWAHDIDIKDIVPDYEENEELPLLDTDDETPKSRAQVRAESKATAKRDRRILEAIAEQTIPAESELEAAASRIAPFRYRDTSPVNFGLSTLDILAADDVQLNQFVGLKKLAPFRDAERKQKERKKLSKKARVRQWRKDTFGREDGPEPQSILSPEVLESIAGKEDADAANGKKTSKKKRSRKRKANGGPEAEEDGQPNVLQS